MASATESSSDASESSDKSGCEVYLHVYDLSENTKWLADEFSLKDYNCGAFHTGVEVYGMEYVFQYYANEPDNNELSGVSAQIPRTDSAYVYRTTIDMGWTNYSNDEVHRIIYEEMRPQWIHNTYHITKRNCVHFSSALCRRLGVKDVPDWVFGAAKTADATRGISALADAAWRAAKYWNSYYYNDDDDGESTGRNEVDPETTTVTFPYHVQQ